MYKFLKHTADIMFEIEANSLNGLFEDAGKAVMATMAVMENIKPKEKREIKIERGKVEDLLYDFISEIIYLKDADFMLFSDFKVKIKEGKTYMLDAVIKGEEIDSKRHKLGVDVKAVTMHEFKVEKKGKKWYAKVLLDV